MQNSSIIDYFALAFITACLNAELNRFMSLIPLLVEITPLFAALSIWLWRALSLFRSVVVGISERNFLISVLNAERCLLLWSRLASACLARLRAWLVFAILVSSL